jgi:hypothetical protein
MLSANGHKEFHHCLLLSTLVHVPAKRHYFAFTHTSASGRMDHEKTDSKGHKITYSKPSENCLNLGGGHQFLNISEQEMMKTSATVEHHFH